jgi:hypothetical protein
MFMNHFFKSFFAGPLSVASLIVCGIVAGLAGPVSAQAPSLEPNLVAFGQQDKPQAEQSKPEKTKSDKRAVAKPIDGKRRDGILKFVRENHPEIVRLIDSLKQKNPQQYQQALRSIEKSIDSLSQLKKTDQRKYDRLLDEWKLNSRIQLLSVQLVLEDTPARRKQLKELFSKLLDRRIAQNVSNRERAAKKLQQLDDKLKKAREGRDKEIQRRMEAVIAKSQKLKVKREQAKRAKELAKKEAQQQKSDGESHAPKKKSDEQSPKNQGKSKKSDGAKNKSEKK